VNAGAQSGPYDWLSIAWDKQDYLPAEYYDRLLKRYARNGREDIELFAEYLADLSTPQSVLELGCGTGRATAVAQRVFPQARHTMLDLSSTMIAAVRSKFPGANSHYVCSDSLEFMRSCTYVYDLVYSLWSFSHSIHQTMERLYDQGRDNSSIATILRKFLINHIRPGGRFYILHFDSQSDEQRILLKQWARVHPIYADYAAPSRSYRLIMNVLEEMAIDGLLRYQLSHVRADPITYADENEALEIFVNFHLEGELRGYQRMDEVISELREYLAGFTEPNGQIAIRPAWYEIKIELLER
jgi:SAM-dependent methyltransferase